MTTKKTTAELIAFVNRKQHLSDSENEQQMYIELKQHLRQQADRLAGLEAALELYQDMWGGMRLSLARQADWHTLAAHTDNMNAAYKQAQQTLQPKGEA